MDNNEKKDGFIEYSNDNLLNSNSSTPNPTDKDSNLNSGKNNSKLFKIIGIIVCVIIAVGLIIYGIYALSNKEIQPSNENKEENIDNEINNVQTEDDEKGNHENEKDEKDETDEKEDNEIDNIQTEDSEKNDNEIDENENKNDNSDNDIITGKKIDVSEGFIKAGQELYNKVEPEMTREEIIRAIGEPTKTRKFEGIFGDDCEYLLYIAEGTEATEVLRVSLTEGIAKTIEIPVVSSNITKIYLSKELNSDIEDLNEVLDKIEKDMTLEDVEKVLGKNYYQCSKNSYDSFQYVWYDKKDNHVIVYISGMLRDGYEELVTSKFLFELW